MSLRQKLFKGGVQLGATQAVSQACGFVRNLIVARLLTTADFGIAATFAITVALLDMLGSLSAEKLLVQAEDGNEERFQAVAQLILIFRGIVGAVMLFALSAPVANLFGKPEATWAFRLLALVPLFKGFVHLDMHRVQRQMTFGVFARVDMFSNIVTAAAAWPLTYLMHSYAAMAYLMVGQAFCGAVFSHFAAERPYQLAWDKHYSLRAVHFGWPLMVNSLLMFGIFQGDRFIIGSADQIFGKHLYSLAELGTYSVAFSLTLVPALLVASVSSSLLMPVLSSLQKSPEAFERRYKMSTEALALVSGIFGIGFIVAGGWAVSIMYGSRYATAGDVIGWLAAMQCVRMLRVAPTLAAMSLGDTKNGLIANCFRSIALIISVIVVSQHGSVALIAAAGFGGEILAFNISLLRLYRRNGLHRSAAMKSAVVAGVFLAIAAATGRCLPAHSNFYPPLASLLLITIFVMAMVRLFPSIRLMALPALDEVRRRLAIRRVPLAGSSAAS